MIGDVWGRPADVLVMPDGALLVSDDRRGRHLSDQLYKSRSLLLGSGASENERWQAVGGAPRQNQENMTRC